MRGRFHFFPNAAGELVPVLYGSDLEDGAIAETIFHDVPVRGAVRTVAESRLYWPVRSRSSRPQPLRHVRGVTPEDTF